MKMTRELMVMRMERNPSVHSARRKKRPLWPIKPLLQPSLCSVQAQHIIHTCTIHTPNKHSYTTTNTILCLCLQLSRCSNPPVHSIIRRCTVHSTLLRPLLISISHQTHTHKPTQTQHFLYVYKRQMYKNISRVVKSWKIAGQSSLLPLPSSTHPCYYTLGTQ